MNSSACRDVRELLGVYVTGAIEPADRAVAEDHLSQCQRCREELADLALIPALLHRVPVAEAEQIAEAIAADAAAPSPAAAPEAVLTRLLGKIAAQRRARRLRTVFAAAAAVLIAAGGAAAATYELSQSGQPARSHDVAFGAHGTTAAWVSYQKAAWGTELWVRVTGIRAGTTCTFWVRDRSGHWLPDGSWKVRPGSSQVWYPAATSVPEAQVTAFKITSGQRTLVTVPAT